MSWAFVAQNGLRLALGLLLASSWVLEFNCPSWNESGVKGGSVSICGLGGDHWEVNWKEGLGVECHESEERGEFTMCKR